MFCRCQFLGQARPGQKLHAELKSAVAALQLSIAPAEHSRDEGRNNIHSLRAKLTAELKSAVAALQLSIARAEIPRDEVQKNVCSLRAKLRAELNSDVVDDGQTVSIFLGFDAPGLLEYYLCGKGRTGSTNYVWTDRLAKQLLQVM